MAHLLDKVKKIEYVGEKTDTVINLGDIIMRKINNISVINLEKMIFQIKGFKTKHKKIIDKLLENSQWTRIKKQLGFKLASEGTGALMLDEVQKQKIILSFDVTQHKKIGKKLLYVEGWSQKKFLHPTDKQTYPTYIRMALKNGSVWKKVEYEKEELAVDLATGEDYTERNKYTIQKWKKTPLKIIPVQIFDNNEWGKSEMSYGNAFNLVRTLNYYSNQIEQEWHQIKSVAVGNQMLDQEITSAIYWRQKKEGFIKTSEPDTQAAAAVGIASLDGASMLNLLGIQDYLEKMLYKACLSFKNPEETGTNKHNPQIANFYNEVIENMDNKREIREEDYKSFFQMLSIILFNKINENIEVIIPLSPLMKNLIKASDPHGIVKIQTKSAEKIAKLRDEKPSKIKKFFGKE